MYLSYKLRSKTLGQNLSSSKQCLDDIRKAAIWESRTKADKIFATGFGLQCRLRDQVSNRSCIRSHDPVSAQQRHRDRTRLYRHNCYSLTRHLPRRRCGGRAWGCLKGQINAHSDIYGGSKGKRYKGRAILLQAWTGLEGFRRFRLPDFKTISKCRW